jgi:hypothetical protein
MAAEPGEPIIPTFKFVNRIYDSDEEQLGLARLGTVHHRHLPRVEAGTNNDRDFPLASLYECVTLTPGAGAARIP